MLTWFAALFLMAPVLSLAAISQLGLTKEWRKLDHFLSRCVTWLRLWSGSAVADMAAAGREESRSLVLYDLEGCPQCRRVREALSELGMDCEIRPCPYPATDDCSVDGVEHGLSRFRPDVIKLGGKLQVPFLIDRSQEPPLYMYESSAIVKYLWRTYGDEDLLSKRWSSRLPGTTMVALFSSFVASLLRTEPRMGLLRMPTKAAPKQAMLLVSYESEPRCRLIREALCVLELPWLLQQAPSGSWRQHMMEAEGKAAPWFYDLNSGFESSDPETIVQYLFAHYSAGEVASDFDTVWAWKLRFGTLWQALPLLRRPSEKL